MGYRAEPPPLPDETDGGRNRETLDTPLDGIAGVARSPQPGTPAGDRERREWDWEYGLLVQSTPPRARGRPGRVQRHRT